jgi:DNA-binding NtrC family response regulator
MAEDILYLDDDPEMRELAKMYLGERKGYDVRTPESPEEGIDLHQDEKVVITEYPLGGQPKGMDIAEALENDAQVIIYTGYDQSEVLDAGTELPENTQFLTKGGGFKEVFEKVEQAIEG